MRPMPGQQAEAQALHLTGAQDERAPAARVACQDLFASVAHSPAQGSPVAPSVPEDAALDTHSVDLFNDRPAPLGTSLQGEQQAWRFTKLLVVSALALLTAAGHSRARSQPCLQRLQSQLEHP